MNPEMTFIQIENTGLFPGKWLSRQMFTKWEYNYFPLAFCAKNANLASFPFQGNYTKNASCFPLFSHSKKRQMLTLAVFPQLLLIAT